MHAYRASRAFDGERLLPGGALVLVDGDRIAGVESARFPVPAGCAVTDLPGATLLPGLIDAHVHLCGDSGPRALDQLPDLTDAELDSVIAASLDAQLAGGVTAVRDLGDARWAVADRHRGRADGPTVVAAGPPITSPGGHCAGMGGEASGADGLRRAVRERVEHGVDVVKVMTSGGMMTLGTDVMACQFTLEELRLVVDEAHHGGLPVTGHAHGVPAVDLCLAAGVDGIEHCTCMTPDGIRMPAGMAQGIAAAGIAVCPTNARAPGAVPPPHIQALLERTHMAWEDRYPQFVALHGAGVTLVGGTDAGINPAKPHGIMCEHVIELVTAGLPVTAALAAATSVAAVVCGLRDRTGRLAAGLDADLLAVGGDAVTDVPALRDVRLVVSRGREVVSGGQ
ncbi:amidohydrolase family protein [Blastococcus jejuensis]|uniref:Amidohydrolase family protein n=1 Tax=Blastococcus jejuensis TaxID=351224 RepID=A0ABP6P566_9ACTN